jgi:hypothetical protein
MPYRKFILKAVEELRDSHMRSSIDAIYRYVESHLPDGVECNYPLFLTDLKAMAEDGIIEATSTHCSFSPEYKKRRVSEIHARALILQAACPNLSVTMDVVSAPSAKPNSYHHIKHKQAKRRILSRYMWW